MTVAGGKSKSGRDHLVSREIRQWDFYMAAMYELHRAGHNLWPVTLNMPRMQNRMPCLTCMWRPIDRWDVFSIGRIAIDVSGDLRVEWDGGQPRSEPFPTRNY